MGQIEAELQERLAWFEQEGKLLEAQRLRMRTQYDLEMMGEVGYCNGIENYSMHIDGRDFGEPPFTLLDYFPDDFLLVIDESHQARARSCTASTRATAAARTCSSSTASACRRPATTARCTFEEVLERINQCVFMSATPGPYELRVSDQVVEQIVRPTGLVDPEVIVKPTKGQIDDLIENINDRVTKGDRVLVTTLTKKMAEDLTDYLLEQGLRVRYLHSNIDTVQRIEILRALRLGEFDVLVGINLLREGLDLPEVSLVAILDADKEGFLRSRDVADPDDRPRRPQRRRPGDHVRRQDHRLDDAGDRPDQQPARRRRSPTTPSTGSTRRRSARRSATSCRCCARRRRLRPCPARTGAASASGTRSSATSRRCRSRSWPASSRRSRRRCTRPRPTSASSTPPACATRSTTSAARAARDAGLRRVVRNSVDRRRTSRVRC